MLFLQPVPVPEHIFLGEVLYWVAFQRLPKPDFNEDGQEIHDGEVAAGLAIEIPFPEISDEEADRIGIPPDPRYLAMVDEQIPLSLSHYDQLLRFPGLSTEEKARFEGERKDTEIYQQELAAWRTKYKQGLEYSSSQIFVALKRGELQAMGRLLPGYDQKNIQEWLDRDERDFLDYPIQKIPSSFWTLTGMDFEASSASNGSKFYCHVVLKTVDVLSCFPGDRVPVAGVERVGDSYVVSEASAKLPQQNRRGRPPYAWDSFHLEVAALIEQRQLPEKKEAAIQHFQTWFKSTHGVEPSRAAIGEKLKPYYDRFRQLP
ncbi:hypothetical protein [Rhodoplanes sp. Z2-YC6860]|uniref:hypothetical protein n=1 Tax=Rhodoplanes sp. Z2-YC6860 TaxID=674703 RepID=UPI00082EF0A1|nr:hypothetical protein [Rhodoplanes sp. Z2-YC6860]